MGVDVGVVVVDDLPHPLLLFASPGGGGDGMDAFNMENEPSRANICSYKAQNSMLSHRKLAKELSHTLVDNFKQFINYYVKRQERKGGTKRNKEKIEYLKTIRRTSIFSEVIAGSLISTIKSNLGAKSSFHGGGRTILLVLPLLYFIFFILFFHFILFLTQELETEEDL